ncbi:unnamed protein product [Auanema sp. JU1783]|nr:unnamed protein product [Auanema sp. JU1783]
MKRIIAQSSLQQHDFVVNREIGLYSRKNGLVQNFYQKDLSNHFGCVNALNFSGNQDFFLSGGDDRSVLMWKTSEALLKKRPEAMKMDSEHISNIFAVEFNCNGNIAYSGGNDCILFAHDCSTGKLIRSYTITCPVFDVDAHVNSSALLASSEGNGSVEFFDVRDKSSESILHIELSSRHERVYTGRYNPAVPNQFLIASSRDLQVHDLRFLTRKDVYKGLLSTPLQNNVMFANWNSKGTGVIALEAGHYPIYYDLMEKNVVRLLDDCYSNYHTVKSADLIDDRYFVSGSDTFDLFIWDLEKKEEERGCQKASSFKDYVVKSSDHKLEGHRSIVNNVCYSSFNDILISSGVEKIVKVWCPYAVLNSYKEPNKREIGSLAGFLRADSDEGEDIETLLYFDSLLMDPGMDLFNEELNFDDDEDSSDSNNVYKTNQAQEVS